MDSVDDSELAAQIVKFFFQRSRTDHSQMDVRNSIRGLGECAQKDVGRFLYDEAADETDDQRVA
jgi:hypothetical protein